MRFDKAILFLLVFILSGCGGIVNYSPNSSVPRDGKIIVLPFQNNSDAPLAGQKVKNILANVLYSKGFDVEVVSLNDEDYITQDKAFRIADRKGAKYFIFGSVNEWRYKTGIEAEPAVSLDLRVIDRESERVVYSAVGAKNGWSDESLGSVAQKLILELVR
ncbi:MAG: hypothetical protein GXO31_08315 [Epsilonproteobacteria bacterium]|nr:hypothetical protein [Campylobacterota bacterium]